MSKKKLVVKLGDVSRVPVWLRRRSQDNSKIKLRPAASHMALFQGDITTLQTDAIVNAANAKLAAGSGVCGAIFRAAGHTKLQSACWKHESVDGVRCPTGQARVTPGFDLPASHVVHAVGPVYDRKRARMCAQQLASCYRSSLHALTGVEGKSIAFPAISTGVYGYPKEAAARIAVRTVAKWIEGTQRSGQESKNDSSGPDKRTQTTSRHTHTDSTGEQSGVCVVFCVFSTQELGIFEKAFLAELGCDGDE